MDRTEAGKLARHLMGEYGLDGWTFTFGRAVHQYGSCDPRKRVIRLSGPLTDTNDRAQVEDTIRHEIAHALVAESYGRSARPHGPEWRRTAQLVGADPQATGHGAPSQVPPPYLGVCPGCGREQRRYRRRACSCGRCSANGRYDERFRIVWTDTRTATQAA